MTLDYIGKSIRPLRLCTAHMHEKWELVFNEKGMGTMILDEKARPFGEGSIILYPPGTIHQKIAKGYFEDYYVLFSSCDLFPQIYCFDGEHSEEILQLLKIMYRRYHEFGNTDVCSKLLDAVLEILSPDRSGERMDNDIRQMRRIMIDRFADADFRVKDALSEIHLNEDYLRRKFKRVMGVAPHAYLESLRIENAKRLLAQADTQGLTVSDVAYLSGFYDNLYFSRVFHRLEGMSPSEWKKKIEKAEE